MIASNRGIRSMIAYNGKNEICIIAYGNNWVLRVACSTL